MSDVRQLFRQGVATLADLRATRPAGREAVYDACDGERDYQDSRWNPSTTTSEGKHTVTEWLAYMQDYLTQAIHQASRGADPEASAAALHTIRKITTMGIACMEQNGAPHRENF